MNIIPKLFLSCLLVGGLNFYAVAQYDKIVAADGSGDFTTIQAAILAAPAIPTIPYSIYIKNGFYNEKVTINRTFITLVGESAANVIISWDDYYLKVPNLQPKSTATVTINANDVVMINITVENRSANTADGPQALALNVNRDRCAFKHCRFIGGQDTIATDRNGTRQLFLNCYIDGNTDFIYGSSTALFDRCVIFPRDRIDGGSGGYITAANTPDNQPYGYVFRECIIPENKGITSYTLGRPWGNDGSTPDADKAHNKTVFLLTTMGASIKPAGWSVWNSGTNTSFITYAEYNSMQIDWSPVDVSGRVSWSRQLSYADYLTYTTANVFSNASGTWDPCTIGPDFCMDAPAEIALSNFRLTKGATTSKITGNIDWPIDQVNAALMRSDDGVIFNKLAETELSLANYNFSFTDDLPPPGTTYTYKMVATKTGLNTFISDTIKVAGASVVVPLKLLLFTAGIDGSPTHGVKLEWKTTGEENILFTAIEKSVNNIDFKEIGQVSAKNTEGVHSYEFVDRAKNQQDVYYRLKLVDATGKIIYSQVKKVSIPAALELSAYPNPVINGVTLVSHPRANVNTRIAIASSAGTIVMNVNVNSGASTTAIDFRSLPKGVYLLQYLQDETSKVLRIVVP